MAIRADICFCPCPVVVNKKISIFSLKILVLFAIERCEDIELAYRYIFNFVVHFGTTRLVQLVLCVSLCWLMVMWGRQCVLFSVTCDA